MRPRDSCASGLLVVDKPGGMTSHDVVATVRRALGVRRVGHAGTLDPMATGVLVVLVGEATKLAPYLALDRKRYLATVELGVATDSLDADGVVCARASLPAWWRDPDAAGARIAAALEAERARSAQAPPALSAIKIAGRTAHARVRAGETVVLAARAVRVHALALTGRDPRGALSLDLTVSKGYYVRALARDLGERLGIPAHLGALRRTASGALDLARAVPLEALSGAPLVPLAEAAALAMPTARLGATGAERARRGAGVQAGDFSTAPPDGLSAWLDDAGALVCVGRFAAGHGAVERVFQAASRLS
jgi:tRNA pseudouridine55 synthase